MILVYIFSLFLRKTSPLIAALTISNAWVICSLVFMQLLIGLAIEKFKIAILLVKTLTNYKAVYCKIFQPQTSQEHFEVLVQSVHIMKKFSLHH